MFEDSTFETMGTIHTRSRGWMMATFAFNSSILLALVIIPILHPEMLPHITNAIPIDAPAPVTQDPTPVARTQQAPATLTETPSSPLQAQRQIPRGTWIPTTAEPLLPGNLSLGGSGPVALPGVGCNPFSCSDVRTVVRPAPPSALHVSSGVMQGMLIDKVIPTYSAIARATRTSGTVVLQATISRAGTIENLRVVSGPALLRQSALDAVKHWRYRPYMLNGQPVEVETAVEVNFTLD
jgi:protein TonB